MYSTQTTMVWDPLVRFFHWSLVFFFCLAFVTDESFPLIHVFSGYALIGLISIRLVWGVIGSKYARFTSFVRSPATTKAYIKTILAGKSRRHIGHNPAGGAMVIALLLSILMTIVFGMALWAIEGEGLWAGTFISTLPGGPVEALHEFFANATLGLVALHVVGVLVTSLMHGENLIRSMWTGRKALRSDESDLTK